MSEFDFDLPEFTSGELPESILSFGGNNYEITTENTLLMRYQAGGGMFDHLMHRLPDGNVFLMLAADQEALDYFATLEENSRCRIICQHEPPEAIIQLLVDTLIDTSTSD